MDHDDARELIELATAEPGGLERLMAGDTREASVLAAHLAGCDACAEDVERARRDGAILREAIRSAPRSELRERTLGYVRAVGRDRTAAAGEASGAQAAEAAVSAEAASGSPASANPPGRRRGVATSRRRLAGIGQIAAAVALVAIIAGSSAFVALRVQGELQEQRDVAGALARVTTWTLRVDGAADGRRVELGDGGAGDATGTLVFAPSSGELVVVATGLVEPAEGRLYRCWVEVDGERRNVGRMFFGGGIAYWAGRVEGLTEVPPGAIFGIGVIPDDGSLASATPELLGEL